MAVAEISKGVTTVKGSPKVVMDSKKRQQKLRERREREREREGQSGQESSGKRCNQHY